jgi:hypothetical protein
MKSLLSLPPFPLDQRPPAEEVESYTAAILQHEGRSVAAIPACRREAELQLWAARSMATFSLHSHEQYSPVVPPL